MKEVENVEVLENEKKEEVNIIYLIHMVFLNGYTIAKNKGFKYNNDIAYFYHKKTNGWYFVDTNLHEVIEGYDLKEEMLNAIPKYQEKIKKMIKVNVYSKYIKTKNKIIENERKKLIYEGEYI